MPTLKVALLGDAGVGKSSLVARLHSNAFDDHQEPTIGASFQVHRLIVGATEWMLEIWDTAGQERYRSLAPMYYRGADALVVVYDVTSPRTEQGALAWIAKLRRSNPSAVVALVGNKSDLNPSHEMPATEDAALSLLTSAKTSQNVQALFCGVASRCVVQETREPNVVLSRTRRESCSCK